EGKLEQTNIQFDDRIAVGVVLAENGYPGKYNKGIPIPHLKEIHISSDYKVFHAGTLLTQSEIVTNGGRVLCATALGKSYHDAQKAAYNLAAKVAWDSAFYRTDIG